MERRTNERFKVEFEANVRLLGDQKRSALGRVSDISAKGLSVELPFQLVTGDIVELEMADSMLLGQVIYSNPDKSSFRTGIEASRVKLGGTDLSSLLQRVLMDVMPGMPGLEPVEASLG